MGFGDGLPAQIDGAAEAVVAGVGIAGVSEGLVGRLDITELHAGLGEGDAHVARRPDKGVGGGGVDLALDRDGRDAAEAVAGPAGGSVARATRRPSG